MLFAGGAVAAGVGGYAGAVISVFSLRDRLRKIFPISQYRVDCWKSLLADQVRELRRDCKKQLSGREEAALTNNMKTLESVALKKSDEIEGLRDKSHILNQLAAQLRNICDRVQTTTEEFDVLLAA